MTAFDEVKGRGLPLCDEDNIEQAVGIVGAVIMPRKRNNCAAIREGNYYFTIEGGMLIILD